MYHGGAKALAAEGTGQKHRSGRGTREKGLPLPWAHTQDTCSKNTCFVHTQMWFQDWQMDSDHRTPIQSPPSQLITEGLLEKKTQFRHAEGTCCCVDICPTQISSSLSLEKCPPLPRQDQSCVLRILPLIQPRASIHQPSPFSAHEAPPSSLPCI